MNIYFRITAIVLCLGLLITPVATAAPPSQDDPVVIVPENVEQVIELESFSNIHQIDAPDPLADASALATSFGVWLYDENGDPFDLLQLISPLMTRNTAWSADGRRIATGYPLEGITVFEYPSLEPINILPDVSREIGFMAFSPDGTRLLTSGNFYDHDVELWDIETGELITFFESMSQFPSRAFFVNDGQQIVLASFEGKIFVRDVVTAEPLVSIDIGGTIQDAVLSPDESTAYIGLWNGNLAAASLTEGQILWQQQVEWDNPDPDVVASDVSAIAVSPDGATLVVGTSTGQLEFRDAATGEITDTIAMLNTNIADVAYSPDGGTIYALQRYLWGNHSMLFAFTANEGQLIAEIDTNSGSSSTFVPFSSLSGTQFAADNGNLTEFDSDSGELLRTFDGIALSSAASALAIDENSVLMSTPELSENGTPIRHFTVYDLADGTLRTEFSTSQSSNIVSISPDQHSLAVGLWNGGIEVFDLETGEQMTILNEGMSDSVLQSPIIRNLLWSPDGSEIWAYFLGGEFRIWEVGADIDFREMFELDINTKAIATGANGRPIAIYYAGADARISDIETGETLVEFSNEAFLRSVAISNHGQLAAFTTANGDVGFVDMASGETVHLLIGQSQTIWSIEWSYDDSRLLTVASDGTRRIWGISAD